MAEESMTPDLVERWREGFEAGRRADVEGMMRFYAPEVILEVMYAGLTFAGLSEIRRFYQDFFDLWEDLVSEMDELLDLGNGVVLSVVSNRGRPVGSTAEAQQRVAWVSTWEGRKILRINLYLDIDEARATAERLAKERG